METESTLGLELAMVPETRIWRAVIACAVEDWVSGPLRTKREAEAYLFDDQSDFLLVCDSAGMNVDLLRSRLKRMPNQPAVPDASGAGGPKPRGARWPERGWQSATGNSAGVPRA